MEILHVIKTLLKYYINILDIILCARTKRLKEPEFFPKSQINLWICFKINYTLEIRHPMQKSGSSMCFKSFVNTNFLATRGQRNSKQALR